VSGRPPTRPSRARRDAVATLLGAGALVLCCGIGTLIASGVFATVAGALARFWPITVAGVAILAYAGVRIARIKKSTKPRRQPMTGEGP